MKSCATAIGYAVLAAVGILVLIIVVGALINLYTPSFQTGSARSRPSTSTVNRTVTISCPDCDDAGIPIYVRRTPDGGGLACQIVRTDNHSAAIIAERRSTAGQAMIQVRTSKCTGWVPASLVKR